MKKRCAAAVILAAAGLCAPAAHAGPDISGEVFYQIMPIAWRDSNSDANRYGDFGGLTASLDYLQQLGITSIYLQPIFPSAAYHGYQHGDAGQLNTWFGTEPRSPKVKIEQGVVLQGPLRFEREVDLYVASGVALPKVEGVPPRRYQLK